MSPALLAHWPGDFATPAGGRLGTKVIERLPKDLKREFPDMREVSGRDFKYMRAFAEAYPDESFVHQAGGQIPWQHSCILLDCVKAPEQRI